MDAASPVPTLAVLEPSPVDEDPDGSSGDYFPPQPSSKLGLTSHHLPYYLHRAQKYSSIAFTLFTAMHMANTSLIPLATRSADASNTYLLLTRPYYQSPIAEPLVVALPLLTHVAAGVALRLHRRRAAGQRLASINAADKLRAPAAAPRRPKSLWPSLSWTSVLGFAAVPLVAGHACLTRALPLAAEGSSAGVGLDYVGHAVARHPALGFAGFVALLAVVPAHVVWGSARWLGWTPAAARTAPVGDAASRRLAARKRWWVLQAGSVAVALVWAAGGLGVVARGGRVEGWVGRGYDRILDSVPLVRAVL